MSPHASPTGARHLAALGNAGPSRRWPAVLPPCTYYWSVQPIDTAFVRSPFSAEASFTITNSRPTIAQVTNQTSLINHTSAPIHIAISDVETSAADLLLSAASSKTNIVPAQNLFLGGSFSNRTLAISPATNATGSVNITLTVMDAGGLTRSSSFWLNVTNRTPVISDIPNQGTPLARSTAPIPFTVSDADADADLLTVAATSSNTNLFPVSNIVFGGNGSNRTVTLTPVGVEPGTSSITITVTDPYGVWASDSFIVAVERFSLVVTNLIATTRGSLAWGDYDNDGDLDLVISGQHASIFEAQPLVYRNDDGRFTHAITLGDNLID